MPDHERPQEYNLIADIARGMLSEEIHYLDGSLQLVSLRQAIGAYENDPDFLPFIGICYEIESLPIPGGFQQADQFLRDQYKVEIAASVEWAKSHSEVQCRSLMERFV